MSKNERIKKKHPQLESSSTKAPVDAGTDCTGWCSEEEIRTIATWFYRSLWFHAWFGPGSTISVVVCTWLSRVWRLWMEPETDVVFNRHGWNVLWNVYRNGTPIALLRSVTSLSRRKSHRLKLIDECFDIPFYFYFYFYFERWWGKFNRTILHKRLFH